MKFSLSACLALLWLTTVQGADPKPIVATVGHEFKFTLSANATTGYHWQLAQPLDAKLVKLVNNEYLRPKTKLVGAGGQSVWTFQPLAEGKTEITLDYVRPWEKGVKPVQTTNFTVIIKPATKSAPQPESKPAR